MDNNPKDRTVIRDNTEVRPVDTKPRVAYREKNRLSNVFTRTLLSFLLILCGIAIVWLWIQWRDTRQDLSNAQHQITTLNQDKSSLSQQIGGLRATGPDESASTNSQSDELLMAAQAYANADKTAKPLDSTAFKITDQTDEFGRVSVAVPEGPGYYILFKRSIKTWVPIASGQDTVPQAVVDRYGIPADFR